MTRTNKCDACRRAKIKCDESLPQCSNCVRLGKSCTHDQYRKKEFTFVQVEGDIVEAADGPAGSVQTDVSEDALAVQGTRLRQRKFTVGISQRHDGSAPSRPRVALSPSPPVPEPSQVSLIWPRCEESMLLARWLFLMRNYTEHVDSYGGWSEYVPHYLGKSEAVDKAARCFMESRQAMANPTEANLRILRSSNVDAVRSIRQALEMRGSRPCKGDILLAIQLLYVVEALLLHNPLTFVIHAEGLIDLLKEHKKHLSDSDDQEKLMSRIIFQSNFANGLVPALFAGTNHKLDDPEWLTAPLLLRSIPGISNPTAQHAWSRVARYCILIPRLARLVRLLVASANDKGVEKEAMDLAQHLFTNTVDAEFFREAMASGELRLEQTVLPEIVELVPKSYHFGSVRLTVFLAGYWTCRLFICGLLEALLLAVPFASLQFDAETAHDEDISLGTDALMAAQHTLGTTRAAVDRAPYRGDDMRLLMLLEASYGSWYRLERRLEVSGDSLAKEKEEQERARGMKRLCLDMANQLLVAMQATPATENGLEAVINLFSGGPLFGS